MKWILTLVLCLIYLNINPSIKELKGNKLNSIKSLSIEGKELIYKKVYQETIETLKRQEGFRAYFYSDNGYQCIGYGQRIKFYSEKIQEPVTKEQATRILEKSFNNHIKLVKRIYPKLDDIRVIELAHISYQSGIVKVIKLMKNQYELQNSNQRTTVN
jgi:GH24 family phage-related lysozyme (muramidase)